MKLESVTAEIRPRSDWEAVDLGFAMARRAFWRCCVVWWLAVLPPLAVAGCFLWEHPVWLLLLFVWARPAGARMVLFELSRRLFGEQPEWRQVWRELPRAWGRRFFYRFLWARFSPYAPVTMAVEDLEGLRGKAYRLRCRFILRRGDSAAVRLSLGGLVTAVWLTLGLLGLGAMLLPEGQAGPWREAIEGWNAREPFPVPPLLVRTLGVCYLLAQSWVDVFVAGAGFGIYVNNRTWIEGWDVELAFKRLAHRIGGAAALLLAACVCFASPAARARQAERPAPEAVIREVKAHPDFVVHKVKERVRKDKPEPSNLEMPDWWLAWMKGFGRVLFWLIVSAAVAWLVWLLVRYRHLFARAAAGRGAAARPSARVVLGMEVSPESLPEDVPSTAWRWWSEGRRHEALALLYRGAISRLINRHRVEIAGSDTEGDCLRRVESSGAVACAEYFRRLTGVWIRLAYAKQWPADEEVDGLCRSWPFVGGGRA